MATQGAWRSEHMLTGSGIHGCPVEVAAGVVDTQRGPVAALRVGICVVLLDEVLSSGITTNVRRAIDDSLMNRNPVRP